MKSLRKDSRLRSKRSRAAFLTDSLSCQCTLSISCLVTLPKRRCSRSSSRCALEVSSSMIRTILHSRCLSTGLRTTGALATTRGSSGGSAHHAFSLPSPIQRVTPARGLISNSTRRVGLVASRVSGKSESLAALLPTVRVATATTLSPGGITQATGEVGTATCSPTMTAATAVIKVSPALVSSVTKTVTMQGNVPFPNNALSARAVISTRTPRMDILASHTSVLEGTRATMEATLATLAPMRGAMMPTKVGIQVWVLLVDGQTTINDRSGKMWPENRHSFSLLLMLQRI